MVHISLEQAIESRACRICGRPIGYPGVPEVALDFDDYTAQAKGDSVSTKNGAEYAHVSCIRWDSDVPWGD